AAGGPAVHLTGGRPVLQARAPANRSEAAIRPRLAWHQITFINPALPHGCESSRRSVRRGGPILEVHRRAAPERSICAAATRGGAAARSAERDRARIRRRRGPADGRPGADLAVAGRVLPGHAPGTGRGGLRSLPGCPAPPLAGRSVVPGCRVLGVLLERFVQP